MQLNPEQLQAIHYIDGPLFVLAGAGSGKTRVITQKIEYLIRNDVYAAKHITAVTFTNKAAREMQHRINQAIPSSKRKGLHISTFHTLGLKIIRQEHHHLGLHNHFSIYDQRDSEQLVKQLLPANLSRDNQLIQSIIQKISKWKNKHFDIKMVEQAIQDNIDETALKVFEHYDSYLRAYHAVDFDDLILLPIKLFSEKETIQAKWQSKIRYLLIDEYQDTNHAQYTFIKSLMSLSGKMTCVGDEDQTVYLFRGAEPENLNKLQQDFPSLKVIKLEQNYRSTQTILDAANALISHNPRLFEKKLWSQYGQGHKIRIINCEDEQSEAEQVVAELVSHKLRENTFYKDYAILYRNNYQARLFEKYLKMQQIPYQISGATSFFSHTEIKDILAYLRLMINPEDNTAFLRIINTPKRGIGHTTLEKLANYAKQRGISFFLACQEFGLNQVLDEKSCQRLREFHYWLGRIQVSCDDAPIVGIHQLIADIEYYDWLHALYDTPQQAEKRIERIQELIQWIEQIMQKNEFSLQEAINRLILIDLLENQDENASESVQLMTLHSAKGLEFPYVYLVGMEEEMLPHKNSIELDLIEEERRLTYVGITRAKRELTLTLAETRHKYGQKITTEPSRFLDELPDELLVWQGFDNKQQDKDPQETALAHFASLRSLLESK